jgi:hypothetical protein
MANSCFAFTVPTSSFTALKLFFAYLCLMREWTCVRCWLLIPVLISLFSGSCFSLLVLPADLLTDRFI